MKFSLFYFIPVLFLSGIGLHTMAQTSATAITDFGKASGDGIVTIFFDDSAKPNSIVSGSFLHGGDYNQPLVNVTLQDGGVYSFGNITALSDVDAKLDSYGSTHLILTTGASSTTLSANSAGYAPGFYDYHGNLTTSGKIILNDGGDKECHFYI